MPSQPGLVIKHLPSVTIEEMPGQFDSPTAVQVGRKTVTTAGSPVALSPTSVPLTQGVVYIAALAGNSGVIYVGGSGVSDTTGFELPAGASLPLAIDDLAKVYIDASDDAQGVSFHYA